MVQTCEKFRYYNKLKIIVAIISLKFLQQKIAPLKIQGNAKDHYYYQQFRRIYYCALSIQVLRGLLGNEIVPYFFISLDYTNPRSVDDLNSRLGYYLYYVHRVTNIKPIAISHLLYYLDQNKIKRYYVDDPVCTLIKFLCTRYI